MSEVFDIADRYCTQLGALDPCSATYAGIPGHDHEMTDYSPAGAARRIDLVRETLAALAAAPKDSDDDRLAASVMTERCTLDVEQYEAGERLRDIRIIGSPIQSARQCFDLMRFETDDDWEVAAERMTSVPASLESIEASLRDGVAQGLVAARRQALACAEQAATWGGERESEPFFRALAGAPPGRRAARRRGRTGHGRVRAARRVSARRVRARGRSAQSRRSRPLHVVRARLQRHRPRPRGDVRVGLGRAAPDRGRDAPRRRAHPPRRVRSTR